eukprot:613854-Pleurochrysis_carterae.AAC.1
MKECEREGSRPGRARLCRSTDCVPFLRLKQEHTGQQLVAKIVAHRCAQLRQLGTPEEVH